MKQSTFEEFQKTDIRVGKIVKAELLENSKYTTHGLTIDFGSEIGIKKSGARLINYSINELIGKKIVGVVNFPPKQIGKFVSEALTLGVPDEKGDCVLVEPDNNSAIIGGKLY